MKAPNLVMATRFVSGVYAFSAGLMALGSPLPRVLFTAAMSALWLILAQKMYKETLTLKSAVKMFLALAAIYLLASVDYFMDGLYVYAGCNFVAFVATLAVALLFNSWVPRR